MIALFYICGAVAVAATLLAVTRSDAVHALLYVVVSLLAVAVLLFLLGAPFAAALEAIVYAGAIVVLFLFAVMMLGARSEQRRRERSWLMPRAWFGAGALAAVLLVALANAIDSRELGAIALADGSPTELGRALYGPYLITVELASMILLAGIVGALHMAGPRREA